jgi:hypothetical protein
MGWDGGLGHTGKKRKAKKRRGPAEKIIDGPRTGKRN